MNEKALLLAGPSELSVAGRLKNILAVFGVEPTQMTVTEFLAADASGPVHLLSSSATFLELAAAVEKSPEAAAIWRKKAGSAFVFAGDDLASFKKLAPQITGDSEASLAEVPEGAEWNVADNLPAFCKSMQGVRAAAAKNGVECELVFNEKRQGSAKIISGAKGAGFARVEFESVPVFLSTGDVIDVTGQLAGRIFDVRRCFLAAVPVVLFIKWAFAGTCWQPPETGACLVIDDPLLKSRYGFLKYRQLLDLMERVNFSTSIAFIPWNWNRSSRNIVQMFQQNPSRWSLSIHGCDHTGGEYGSRNRDRLAWKSRQAIQRMARHRSKTGLTHDHVMVFPQGVFSEAAMAALKRDEFIGVVNSEVISTDPEPRAVSVADYWNVAVMNYSDFPIFTRRYPWAGTENFAFDILLGKPCIVVVHHNDFHDGYQQVVECIKRLNGLNTQLRWTNLAEVVRRSFRQRDILPDVVLLEMYGSEIRVENPSGRKKTFRIQKRESAPETLKEILVAGQPVQWSTAGDQIMFETRLDPGEGKTIKLIFKEPATGQFKGESLRYKVKAMVRRYLCEVRDNYVMRKSFSQ